MALFVVLFRSNELEGCVEMFEHFHNSTISLSKVVRQKYKMYNYVTPASYLELNSIFKKLLQDKRTSVEKMRKMYQVCKQRQFPNVSLIAFKVRIANLFY